MRVVKKKSIILVFLCLILPLTPFLNPVAQAEESGAAYVFEPATFEAGNGNRTPGEPTSFSVAMASSGIAEEEVISPTLYAHFQADAFIEELITGGQATVTLTAAPITEGDVPELFETTDELATSVEAIVNDVTNLVTRLTSIAPNVLSIRGLEEVDRALDELDDLEAALNELPAYTQTDVPVHTIEEAGAITVEFGQDFGRHLDEEIGNVVDERLENLAAALDNLDLVLLEDAITDGNVTIIASALEGFLGNIPFLGSILGDSFLGNILGQLGGIIDGLLGFLLPTDAVEDLIEVLNDLIHEISRSVGNLAEDIPVVAETISNEILNFTDSTIATDFIEQVELQVDNVEVNERVADQVEIRAMIADESSIDADLFAHTTATTQVDFGTYVPVYSPLLLAIIVLSVLVIAGLILYIVRLRRVQGIT